MNQYQNVYAAPDAVSAQPVETRATFIRKTYYHLAGALGVFTLLVYGLCTGIEAAGKADAVISTMRGGFTWLLILGGFMAVSWLANSWALSATSKATQYAGLGLYTVAQALLFTPLILFATIYAGGWPLIGKAAAITGFLFLGISVVALTTKKDFSFLGGILKVGFFIALGVLVIGLLGGFSLGLGFAVVMAVLAGASILYSTSNMVHHYNTDQYVAASLGLFASVVLLLWYMIQILLSMANSE